MASWLETLSSALLPIIGGAIGGGIATLIGLHVEQRIQSKKDRDRFLRDNVCNPLMDEVAKAKDGDFIDKSVWGSILYSARHQLPKDLRETIDEYDSKVTDRRELVSDVRVFEGRIHRGVSGSLHGIISKSDGFLTVKIGEGGYYEGDGPWPTIQYVPLREFALSLPSPSELDNPVEDLSDQALRDVQNDIESGRFPYDDVLGYWEMNGEDPNQFFELLYDDVILTMYMDDAEKLRSVETELKELASEIYSELGKILDRQFN